MPAALAGTYPLASFLLAILAVYAVARVYRSIYPYERVRSAMEVLARYRMTAAMRGKRAAKKLRQMEPMVRRARRLLLTALLVKMALLTSVFVATMTIVWRAPFAYSPFDLPPMASVAETEEGPVAVAYVPFIHLFGYIYAILLFRDQLV